MTTTPHPHRKNSVKKPKTIRVRCKHEGVVLSDFGLFSMAYADSIVKVPEDLWIEYVDARGKFEMLHTEIMMLPEKEIMTNKQEWALATATFRDIHGANFVEAFCPHGLAHHRGAHGCHLGKDNKSCCSSCPPEMWEKTTKE